MNTILSSLRKLAALGLSFSVFTLPIFGLPPQPLAPIVSELKTESQLRTEAGSYDTAIREITRVATIKLSTPDDLKAATAIVSRQGSNLRLIRSKLVIIGLSDSGFVDAGRRRTQDRKAAEAFAGQLAKDPNLVFKLSDGQTLANRMLSAVEAHRTLLRKAAEHLKLAAEAIKAKTHHAYSTRSTAEPTAIRSAAYVAEAGGAPVPVESLTDTAIVLTMVLVIACPPLLLVILPVASTALVVAGIAGIIGRLVTNFGTKEGQDKVEDCYDQADANGRRCNDAASNLPFPADLVARAACAAKLLLDLATCPFID
jgi:hypothetical protein